MDIRTTCQGQNVTIVIKGTFNFKAHQDFRKAYQGKPPHTRYVIDLAGVEAIDSSALGMLLVLREYAGGDNAKVALANIPPVIGQILEIARFQELFEMKNVK